MQQDRDAELEIKQGELAMLHHEIAQLTAEYETKIYDQSAKLRESQHNLHIIGKLEQESNI